MVLLLSLSSVLLHQALYLHIRVVCNFVVMRELTVFAFSAGTGSVEFAVDVQKFLFLR